MSLRMKLIIAVFTAAVLALVIAGCWNPFEQGQGGTSRRTRRARTPQGQRCPIDGQPIADTLLGRRPLAVMIENSPKARPQSGLNDACVVYEAITEGGITRFLAIYYHGAPAIIGPVRSARPHFINLEREFDAAFVHCGQSQEALEMLVTTPSIYNLDQMKYPKPFWRDRTRKAPHNLYAAADKLRAFAEQRGWNGAPARLPVFTSRGKLTDGDPAQQVDIDFGGAVKYALQFVFDPVKGGYVRFMDGKLHVDRETGKPVVAQNIIIQRVYAKRYPSNPLHTYDVTVTGEGNGIFITNRQAIPLHWRKGWETDITEYTTEAGGSLPFTTGTTWVEVVPMEGEAVVSTPAPTPPPASTRGK